MLSFTLTNEQQELINSLVKFYKNDERQWFAYSGAAGTGKTTVMKEMVKSLGLSMSEVACLAFVGKAVMVLALNGLNASTIHSLIYEPVIIPVYDDNGDPVYNKNGSQKKKLDFELKKHLNPNIKMIFVDEYSMVPDDIIRDILSFGLPVVFAGDMNQLPPVFGSSTILNHPDFVLTKIMRQAEGNPIIYLSQRVLNDLPLRIGQYGDSRVIKSIKAGDNLLNDYDIILTCKNKTREKFNTYIRSNILHIPNNNPIIGDKVICRQNDWNRCIDEFYLVNGMSGFLTDIDYTKKSKKKLKVDFKPDFLNDEFINIDLDFEYIKATPEERKEWGISKYSKFEYAYAINVHISQGSQYSRVLFIDEHFMGREMEKKIKYTAITRAVNSIDIVLR